MRSVRRATCDIRYESRNKRIPGYDFCHGSTNRIQENHPRLREPAKGCSSVRMAFDSLGALDDCQVLALDRELARLVRLGTRICQRWPEKAG